MILFLDGDKLINSSVDASTKLIDSTITNGKILDGTINGSTKLQDSSITTSKINNLAVTNDKIAASTIDLNAKAVALSLTNGLIAANTIDAAAKVLAGSITLTEMGANSVDTSQLVDDSVTNAKLATGTVSAVIIRDAGGNPQDLALAANEIAVGNGTTVVAANISSLTAGTVEHLIIPVNFDYASVTISFPVFYDLVVNWAEFTVTTDIAATDNATIQFQDNALVNMTGGFIDITLSSFAGTAFSTAPISGNNVITTGNYFHMIMSKTTVGGAGILNISVTRT